MSKAAATKSDAKEVPKEYEIKITRHVLLGQIDKHYCQLVFKEAKSDQDLPEKPSSSGLLSWMSSSKRPIIFNAGGFSVILNEMRGFFVADAERSLFKPYLETLLKFPTFTQLYNYIMDPQSLFHQKAPACARALADMVKTGWRADSMLGYVLFDQQNRSQNGLTQAEVSAALKHLRKALLPSSSAAEEETAFVQPKGSIPMQSYGGFE